MTEYIAAFDIAKKRDYFAGMVFKREKPVLGDEQEAEFLDLVHIEQHGNIEYSAMADIVYNVMEHAQLKNNADLLVDGTGVGEAAIELMRKKLLEPTPIIFTGGKLASEIKPVDGSKGGWSVPKADLVAAGQIIMQQRRLRVADGLRWSDDFKRQLEGFKGKVNENTMRRSYNSETEDLHDDLVVCYLMAAWWFLREKLHAPERKKIWRDPYLPIDYGLS